MKLNRQQLDAAGRLFDAAMGLAIKAREQEADIKAVMATFIARLK